MMTCLILDDDPHARKALESLAAKSSLLRVVKSFDSAVQAASFLYQKPADLLFLDVNLPDIPGYDFLKSLDYRPMTIITTAHPQYAIEGYEQGVVDYLLKPIRPDRFLKAVIKAHQHNTMRNLAAVYPADDLFFVKSGRSLVQIRSADILFVEGMKDYVAIHTENDRIVVGMNLKTIEARLHPRVFFRINRSYIVNVGSIQRINTNTLTIKDQEIPIGEMYKDSFFERFVQKNVLKR